MIERERGGETEGRSDREGGGRETEGRSDRERERGERQRGEVIERERGRETEGRSDREGEGRDRGEK